MDIDEIRVGPEMDALIAEKVMRLTIRCNEQDWPESYAGTIQSPTTGKPVEVWVSIPNYSDMSMIDVVNEITTRHQVSLRLVGPEYANGWAFASGWHATFIEPTYTFTDVGEGATGETPALAICRAALKFMEQQRGD